MAGVDIAGRQSATLPPISHLDLDKIKTDRGDEPRYPLMNGLNVSNAPLASPTMYSGPPPPYSYAQPANSSADPHSGYISPPESMTRRSTREEKETPAGRTCLPSIHEALAAPLSATVPHPPTSTPSTAATQSFPEAPKGPSNPFSQPISAFRDSVYQHSLQNQSHEAPKSAFPSTPTESRPPVSQSFTHIGSPRAKAAPSFRLGPPTTSTFNNNSEPARRPSPPPLSVELPRSSFTFPASSQPPSSYAGEPYRFSAGSKSQDPQSSYAQPPDRSHGDTVKRHLDVFDAEMSLSEICDASTRTLDFSRIWAQRLHQGSRSGFYQDSLPSLHHIEDMMRDSSRTMENLAQLRDIVVAQQHAIADHRARLAHGEHMEDESGLSDEYKGGGFAGGDAKKRRGKAAPPGRCHSCNRAETPEWRRGPDGARTLCNACGLHYAKLTRKMGVNKPSGLTGSNLRPKNMDQRS